MEKSRLFHFQPWSHRTSKVSPFCLPWRILVLIFHIQKLCCEKWMDNRGVIWFLWSFLVFDFHQISRYMQTCLLQNLNLWTKKASWNFFAFPWTKDFRVRTKGVSPIVSVLENLEGIVEIVANHRSDQFYKNWIIPKSGLLARRQKNDSDSGPLNFSKVPTTKRLRKLSSKL